MIGAYVVKWVACNLHARGEFWILSVDQLKKNAAVGEGGREVVGCGFCCADDPNCSFGMMIAVFGIIGPVGFILLQLFVK